MQDIKINRNKIRQFKCNNCGGELQLQNKRSQYVACPYCGSVADSSSEAYKVITQMENPSKFPPMTFIKLGMDGMFNGKMHHVIGRTRRRNTYREFWAEDGESGYSNEEWIFDEWQLISEDGTYFTLIEDVEGFTIVYPVTPKYPSIPQGERMQDFDTGKQKRVQEYGNTEIMFYEGESTYMIQIGDQSSFSEYVSNSASHSAEWRYKDGQIKEVEFFEEVPISSSELMRAFGLSGGETGEAKTDAPAKPETKRLKNRYIVLVAGIINAILAIIGINSVHTTNVLDETMKVEALTGLKGWMSENDTLKSVSYIKKLNLKPDTKVIRLSFDQHVLSDSSECISEIALITKNNNDTIFFDRSYSYKYSKIVGGETQEASSTAQVQKTFEIDSLSSIELKLKFKVPKDEKKQNINQYLGFNIKIDEINSVEIEKGSGHTTLALIFIIVALLVMAFKKKR